MPSANHPIFPATSRIFVYPILQPVFSGDLECPIKPKNKTVFIYSLAFDVMHFPAADKKKIYPVEKYVGLSKFKSRILNE